MDWPRLRNRNGLTMRIMDADPYNLPELPPGYVTTIDKRLLIGEMNRLEQSMMGVYGNCGDVEAERCANITGLSVSEVRKVFRWFLGLPEPYCDGCAALVATGKGRVHQRCFTHAWEGTG